jgi:hypothetical protein
MKFHIHAVNFFVCKKIGSGKIFQDLNLDPDLSKRSRIQIRIWTHNTDYTNYLIFWYVFSIQWYYTYIICKCKALARVV